MSSVKKDINQNDISSLTPEAQNTVTELKKRILDYLTLDVITIKSNFDVFEPRKYNETDIVDIVKKLGEKITVLAQTHQQIDGDCVNAIPTENIGTLSCEEVWKFHSKTVEDAIQRRRDILELILSLIDIISNRNLFDRRQ